MSHSREREQSEREPGGDRSASTAAWRRRGSGGSGGADGELGFVAGGAAEGVFDDDIVVAGVSGPGAGKAQRAGGRAGEGCVVEIPLVGGGGDGGGGNQKGAGRVLLAYGSKQGVGQSEDAGDDF